MTVPTWSMVAWNSTRTITPLFSVVTSSSCTILTVNATFRRTQTHINRYKTYPSYRAPQLSQTLLMAAPTSSSSMKQYGSWAISLITRYITRINYGRTVSLFRIILTGTLQCILQLQPMTSGIPWIQKAPQFTSIRELLPIMNWPPVCILLCCLELNGIPETSNSRPLIWMSRWGGNVHHQYQCNVMSVWFVTTWFRQQIHFTDNQWSAHSWSKVDVDDIPLLKMFAMSKQHSGISAQELSERWFLLSDSSLRSVLPPVFN